MRITFCQVRARAYLPTVRRSRQPLPLKDRHINFLGRYLFNIKASGPGQSLRPLRDPDAVEDDEGEG
ncbi:hypothetical protein ACFW96_28750 [Streptomyces gardneri]|uniref:hypothetical protein n=1 Tax=Streptomyces gardneri TaxID=66892 RepID=UPI0036939C9A